MKVTVSSGNFCALWIAFDSRHKVLPVPQVELKMTNCSLSSSIILACKAQQNMMLAKSPWPRVLFVPLTFLPISSTIDPGPYSKRLTNCKYGECQASYNIPVLQMVWTESGSVMLHKILYLLKFCT